MPVIQQIILIAVFLILSPFNPSLATEPSAAGLWQKIEDGKPVAWVLVIDHDGTFEAVIAKTFPAAGANPNEICDKCTDDRKNAPVLGIPFIRNMKRAGLKYEDGNILNPSDGKTYSAKMTVSPDGQSLSLRPYLGPSLLGKDETWQRLPDTAMASLDPSIVAKYLPAQAAATALPRRRPGGGGGLGGGGGSAGGGSAAGGGSGGSGASKGGGGASGSAGGSASGSSSQTGSASGDGNAGTPPAKTDEDACKERMRKLGVINSGPCVDMGGIIKELEVGTYKFNKPEKAFLGEPIKFVMALATAPDQNVDNAFKGVSGTLTEQRGRFAQSIEATLRGDDFKIEPSGPQERTATTIEPVVWDWTLTPQQGGKKTLAIEVVANIQVGTDHHKVQVRTLYQEIEIQVSTFQRLKNYVVEANGFVIGAAAAVPALAVLFGLIPKARDFVRKGWRSLRGRSSPNRAARRVGRSRRRV